VEEAAEGRRGARDAGLDDHHQRRLAWNLALTLAASASIAEAGLSNADGFAGI
jgi:hypothetical protein